MFESECVKSALEVNSRTKRFGERLAVPPPASSRVEQLSQLANPLRCDPGVAPARDDADELDPRLLVFRELVPLSHGTLR